MSGYVLRGGRVVDPVSRRDRVADVLVEDGRIASVGTDIDPGDAHVVDCSGAIVAPGFVDMHTHLREPGREDEETIASASEAAACGGYTAICAMPNTDPVADGAAVVEKVRARGEEIGLVDVWPAGALTVGLRGEELAAIGGMARSKARVRLFTDDGHGVQNALVARKAMEYLNAFDGVYAEHCEEAALASNGVMNEGSTSLALGLGGLPAAAEEVMAARDVVLARVTGCRLHLLHVSTAGTVEIVRRAKAEGLRVTAEATPHHFSLTDDALRDYDTDAKVNPPLRSEHDRAAVAAAVADGTIDAIATDHAPHARHEKDNDLVLAPPGMVGLETSLALTLTNLVEPGIMGVSQAIERLSVGPAAILGLDDHGGPIAQGEHGNLVAFDPEARWTVHPSGFRSLSSNTPFAGMELRGRVRHTLFRGHPTVLDGKLTGVEVGV